MEVDGASPEACAQEIQRAGEICQRHGALEILVAQNPAQRRDLWDTRRRVSVNLKALHPKKLSEDIVVPRSRIPQMVAAVEAIGRRRGLFVATYGHAGDGNLHANVLFDREDQRPNVDAAIVEIRGRGSAWTAPSPANTAWASPRRSLLVFEQSRGLIALQKRLKAVFDPLGIMNPGKIFPPA